MKLPSIGKLNLEYIQFSKSYYTKLKIMLDYLPYITKSYIEEETLEPDISIINDISAEYLGINPKVIRALMIIILESINNGKKYQKIKRILLDFYNSKNNEINIIRTILIESNKLKERLNKLLEEKVINPEEYIKKENKIKEKYEKRKIYCNIRPIWSRERNYM